MGEAAAPGTFRMNAPPKKPPAEPRASLKLAVQVPSMRVACSKCRQSSTTLGGGAGRVELAIDCRCPIPELMLVLSFPGHDVKLAIEPIGGGA